MTTYRGFNTIGKDFGAVSISDIELVKRDLLNHFSIRKGEKLQNPNYGSSIHDLIMEPLTEEVKSLITDEINNVINSDPRVVAQGIIIDEFANGSIGAVSPESVKRPSLGPRRIAPANAAAAPALCTNVEPAKSEKPAAARYPPPHCHPISIGYINPVKIAQKIKKGQILILSANVPDTIEHVVAQNTI